MRSKTCFAAAVLFLAAGSVAWACNTPVHRYAMYNWPASPYRVFYFHAGAPAKDDLAVNRLLETAGRAQAPLNVALETVDVSNKERFGKLPGVVRKAWDERPAKTTAIHAVFNTHGQKIFSGRLDQAAAKAMIQSPARRRLGELLQQGNAGVLVLLGSPKADRTRRAEQAIDDLLRRVQAGEIVGATPDGPAENPPEAKNTADDAERDKSDEDQIRPDPKRLRVARMTISRTDPAEAWLVRTLLAVEDDLGQYAEEPMVFAVYGRARAMPPFVGKGITPDNLVEGVAFLAGACSCVIKDESPGLDLLVGWDWNATAEALAAEEQDATSDGLGYGETNAEPPSRKPTDKQARVAAAKPAQAKTPSPLAPLPQAGEGSGRSAPLAQAGLESGRLAPSAGEERTAYWGRQLRVVLMVLAVAAVIVLTVGAVWVRRSQAGNP